MLGRTIQLLPTLTVFVLITSVVANVNGIFQKKSLASQLNQQRDKSSVTENFMNAIQKLDLYLTLKHILLKNFIRKKNN